MKVCHKICNIHFSEDYIFITIDGKEKSFRISDFSQTLKHASDIEKNTFEISPSGYGIHWPLIDEDIAIDSLPDPSMPKNSNSISA